mgnify:CR=1 FL=1
MGEVYRAIDRLTGEVVALKRVLLPRGTGANNDFSPQVSRNALRLALAQKLKILAGLRHPCIISVLDYGHRTGNPIELLPMED